MTTNYFPKSWPTAPRKVFGFPPVDGSSYALLDTKARWTLTSEDLHTDCGWSPFEGASMVGRIVEVALRGHTAFKDGQVLAQPGFGKKL